MNESKIPFVRSSWLLLPLLVGLTAFIFMITTLTETAAATQPHLLVQPSGGSVYTVTTIAVTNGLEYRFMYENRHFMTLIDQTGAFIFRPHPGCDVNGWGSSWYAQPFLPGAHLTHTVIQSVSAAADGIHVIAQGKVSRGTTSTYGDWGVNYYFAYNPAQSKVMGSGSYTITLDGPLSQSTGDLNLYRIASNYLDDVPLLPDSHIGDTGDMTHVIAIGDAFVFTWTPPITPGFFPTNETDHLSVDVIGNLNLVDTVAMGYARIWPAFKPSLTVILTSTQLNAGITFGAFYDTAQAQMFWADNVGVTPLIRVGSPHTDFAFAMGFTSSALETCSYLPLMVRSD
jgi:hypothetical protein